MARPRKYIDKDEFEKLCGLQCTKTDLPQQFFRSFRPKAEHRTNIAPEIAVPDGPQ